MCVCVSVCTCKHGDLNINVLTYNSHNNILRLIRISYLNVIILMQINKIELRFTRIH